MGPPLLVGGIEGGGGLSLEFFLIRSKSWLGGDCCWAGILTNTIFYLFYFCEKIIIFLRENHSLSFGEDRYCSLKLILAYLSSCYWTPEGLFEVTRHPSRALNLAA